MLHRRSLAPFDQPNNDEVAYSDEYVDILGNGDYSEQTTDSPNSLATLAFGTAVRAVIRDYTLSTTTTLPFLYDDGDVNGRNYSDFDLIGSSSSNSNDSESFDVDAYLMGELGPKSHFEPALRIGLTVLYSSILFTGLCGNLLTIFVILRNKVMHTTTNFYILNLSIADLTTLMAGLPVEIFFLWQQYPWPFGYPICVLRTALIEFASYNSVMTITAFTTERYIAICHPLKSAAFKSKRSAVRILAIIWLIASAFSLPFALSARTFAYRTYPGSLEDIPESVVCSIPASSQDLMRIAMQISAYVFFLIPLVLVIFLYTLIGMRIRRSLFGQLFSNAERKTALQATNSALSGSQDDGNNHTKRGSTIRLSAQSSGFGESVRHKFRFNARRFTAPTALFFRGRPSIASQVSAPIDEEDDGNATAQRRQTTQNFHQSANRMASTASTTNRFSTSASHRRSGTAAAKRASAPLYLIAVVIAFFICWCPFHLQRLLSIYLSFETFVNHQTFFNILFNLSGILFYVSSTLNPILYSLLSTKFRVAFVESCCCTATKHSRLNRMASVATTRIGGASIATSGAMTQVSVATKDTPFQNNRNSMRLAGGAFPRTAASADSSPMVPNREFSGRALKSALKPSSTAEQTLAMSKKDNSTQTMLSFPASSLVNVAFGFSIAEEGSSEDVRSENMQNYRHQPNIFMATSLIDSGEYTTRLHKSLPNTPLLRPSRYHQSIFLGDPVSTTLGSNSGTPLLGTSDFRSSAAEMVDRIGELYDSEMEDDASLRARILQLSPNSQRKANVLVAYNTELSSPVLRPLLPFDKKDDDDTWLPVVASSPTKPTSRSPMTTRPEQDLISPEEEDGMVGAAAEVFTPQYVGDYYLNESMYQEKAPLATPEMTSSMSSSTVSEYQPPSSLLLQDSEPSSSVSTPVTKNNDDNHPLTTSTSTYSVVTLRPSVHSNSMDEFL